MSVLQTLITQISINSLSKTGGLKRLIPPSYLYFQKGFRENNSKEKAINFIEILKKEQIATHLDAGNSLEPLTTTS